MSKPGAAQSKQLKDEQSTGSLISHKKGDAAQLKDSVSPQKAAQGERHPDLRHVTDALEAAVPVMLLHALLHPAGYQPTSKPSNQQYQLLQLMLPMLAETGCRGLIAFRLQALPGPMRPQTLVRRQQKRQARWRLT